MKTILGACLLSFALAGASALTPALPADAAATNAAVHSHHLPAVLRPVLYRTLARDASSAYHLDENGCAALPASPLEACFGLQGIRFRGDRSPLTLHLVAYGRGHDLTPLSAVRPKTSGNRVSYRHGNLTEWWRILPVGFEQGFTVARRPAGRGEFILALTSSRSAKTGDDGLAWGRLRYGGLAVTDADGTVIPATIESEDNRILIAVNDVHAAYPLTVDPLVWLEQKVTASDGAAQDQLGFAVAVSGNTALIGAPGVTVNGNSEQGAAYLFTDSNGVWTQAQKFTASDGAVGDAFGGAVALDGTTALIGAANANVNGNVQQGAAYVFNHVDGTWSEAQKLTSNDGAAFDAFGHAVAISGNTALVAAHQAGVNGNAQQGAVYVFTGSDGAWTQAQKIFASDGAAYDNFGSSLALSGATTLISAPNATVDGNYAQGAAYLFTDTNGAWTQTQKLTASDGAFLDSFGYAVALDGSTALVGAPYATVNGNSQEGAAYMFAGSGGTWTQEQKLVPPDGGATMAFGQSLALKGTTALINAPWATVNGNDYQGAGYIFNESNGSWNETQKLVAGDGVAGDSFGGSPSAAALTDTTALVGVWIASVNGNTYQGATYFYGNSDLGLAVSSPVTVEQGQQYVSQTIATNNASAASPAVTATITVPAMANFVSATATQGSCNEASGVVTCDFGQISGNAGTATANVTLKATGNIGETIENTASIAEATPPLGASAATTITAGGACPEGYAEYDGSLGGGQRAHSPIYRAPAGEENAILAAPSGFQLYAVFQNAQGRKIFRIPGNEVHRQGPAGTYTWVVKAGGTGGAYTLCLQHP